MAMSGLRFLMIIAWVLVISTAIQTHPSTALVSSSEFNPSYPKAISDLREALVKGLGFQAEGFKISEFDLRDVLVGQSVAYEFDIEVNDRVLPFKLLEDVNKWEYVDLPIFRVEGQVDENGLIEKEKSEELLPVLAPFQLAGPMEIWIQDAKDMRLALPHDVDAGVLRKVILADGAVVTVKGARSVSLRQPLDLPLPLNQSGNGIASSLLSLAQHLHQTSHQFKEGSPLLSLRIVGPTSLSTSPSSSPAAGPSNRLKLKRLAPGLVELSSPSNQNLITAGVNSAAIDVHREAPTLLSPKQFSTLWPITSINGTNTKLLGFEKLLTSVLGPEAQKKGSFKLLRADVSAQTFLKIGFGMEKTLVGEGGEGGGKGVHFQGFPEWRTKPESLRMHFEVLAKVEGDKVVPERVVQVNPVEIEDTVAPNLLKGNTTTSTMPIFNPPPIPLTL